MVETARKEGDRPRKDWKSTFQDEVKVVLCVWTK
jgi:hypothetical protein